MNLQHSPKKGRETSSPHHNPLPQDRRRTAALLAAALVVLAGGGIAGAFALWQSSQETVENAPNAAPPAPAINPYHNLALAADAAVVYDASTGEVLFARNEHAQLPLASLTKLMTAYLASAILPPHDTVTVPAEAILTEGDSGLRSNESWQVRDLIDFTLMSSSNDGAVALAIAAGSTFSGIDERDADAFVSSMNQMARTLGLTQTYYLNPSGLDASKTQSGAYSSALDTAKLLAAIIREAPGLFAATRYASSTFVSRAGVSHVADNTNEPVVAVPGLIGSKTGYTDLAGGNLALAFDAGLARPIVVVVLGSTQEERFTDAKKLVDRTLEYLAQSGS